MEKYISPELEIIKFDSEDVITTSPAGQTIGGGNGQGDF